MFVHSDLIRFSLPLFVASAAHFVTRCDGGAVHGYDAQCESSGVSSPSHAHPHPHHNAHQHHPNVESPRFAGAVHTQPQQCDGKPEFWAFLTFELFDALNLPHDMVTARARLWVDVRLTDTFEHKFVSFPSEGRWLDEALHFDDVALDVVPSIRFKWPRNAVSADTGVHDETRGTYESMLAWNTLLVMSGHGAASVKTTPSFVLEIDPFVQDEDLLHANKKQRSSSIKKAFGIRRYVQRIVCLGLDAEHEHQPLVHFNATTLTFDTMLGKENLMKSCPPYVTAAMFYELQDGGEKVAQLLDSSHQQLKHHQKRR